MPIAADDALLVCGLGKRPYGFDLYAFCFYYVCTFLDRFARRVAMPRAVRLKRKAFFMDEHAVRRARKLLGATTDAEAVRLSVERIAEMEAFWQFMKHTRRTLRPGSVKAP